MADYYASIFGTERDKVNCSFYFKIGACRHGDRCSRVHNKPTFSQTILIQNLYVNPTNQARSEGKEISEEEDQRHFDEFFEDIFVELEEKYGPIEEMNVCDNLGDHLIGNVYVRFKYEEDAERAVDKLNERWFGGKPIYAELSTVSDFREAGCRQYEIGACTRGGFCNFMHLKQISEDLRRHLFANGRGGYTSRRRSRRDRSQRSSHISRHSRSRSPSSRSPLSRSRSRSRSSSLHRQRNSPDRPRKTSSSRGGNRQSSRRRQRRRNQRRPRSPPSRSRSRSVSPTGPNNGGISGSSGGVRDRRGDYDYEDDDDDVEGPPLPPRRPSSRGSRSPAPGARSPRSRSPSPGAHSTGPANSLLRSRNPQSVSPHNDNLSVNNNNSNNNDIR